MSEEEWHPQHETPPDVGEEWDPALDLAIVSSVEEWREVDNEISGIRKATLTDTAISKRRITESTPQETRVNIQRARNRLSAAKHRMRVKDTIEHLTKTCQTHEKARIQAEVQSEFATKQAEKYREEN
ncbi:MAG: uncharacterized protein KVP18_005245, partial [Porospora cf. gigantea A]|uniref:uncharacterized protein n=1 Tax=Porospora cf. gigantea A TaxID=2853593 RepID=UPI00355A5997